jgi:pilus assembly protein CpaF
MATIALRSSSNGKGTMVPVTFNTQRSVEAEKPDAQRRFAHMDIRRVLNQVIGRLRTDNINIDKSTLPQLRGVTREIVDSDSSLSYSAVERQQFTAQVIDEMIGYGPLEPLISDETVTDIQINGAKNIFVEVGGIKKKTTITFEDDEHLKHFIERIVSAVGRRVDETSPMVNARLRDGSRVNVVLPPVSLIGPVVTIRKFGTRRIGERDLIESHSLAPWMMEFLQAAVRARLNIIISGGGGAGKTTLLNVISRSIPQNERMVTIEDSAELQLIQPNVVSLETRQESLEGKGIITQRDLVVNALRMSPDRILVGEVRDEAAFDMLQAMNTGHEGSLTTIHANSPRDALSRLENLVLMGKINMPESSIRNQIASAIDLIVQGTRMSDGTRRITSISEVTGTQGPVISMQEIFSFDRETVCADGRVKGTFRGHGTIPECCGKIELAGSTFPAGFFSQKMEA